MAQPPRLPPDAGAAVPAERFARGRAVDDVLAQSGLFQGLSEEAVEPVVSRLEMLTLPRGRVIFNEGEPGDSLYIVTAGKIKLSRRSPDGRENVLAVMGPSDQFGELSVFDPGPRTATATAVTDVKLARMPQSTLRLWIEAHPEIGEQLLRVLARRLRRTNDSVADLIFTDVPGRVAKALLQMADRFGSRESDGLRVKHDPTQGGLGRGQRPAGQARPHAGGAGPAGRRLAGDGEQGARRLRAPRLDPAAGQVGRRPRRGPPPPKGEVTGRRLREGRARWRARRVPAGCDGGAQR